MTIVIISAYRMHHLKSEPDLKPPEVVQLLDGALDCCQHIATLAQVLQRAGINPDSGMTDPLLVSNAGYLISREIAHLRTVIEQVRTQPDGAPEELP